MAREIFEHFTAVTNREPISSIILKEEGFPLANVSDLACPSFLFTPATGEKVSKLISEEGIVHPNKPTTVGFVLYGWNFFKGPFDQ